MQDYELEAMGVPREHLEYAHAMGLDPGRLASRIGADAIRRLFAELVRLRAEPAAEEFESAPIFPDPVKPGGP